MTNSERAILRESAERIDQDARDAAVLSEGRERSHPIECPRCEITLGEGRDECRRAVGSDLCYDCALDLHGPTDAEMGVEDMTDR